MMSSTPLPADEAKIVHAHHVARYESAVAQVVTRLRSALDDIERRGTAHPGRALMGTAPYSYSAAEVLNTVTNALGNLGAGALGAMVQAAAAADATLPGGVEGLTARLRQVPDDVAERVEGAAGRTRMARSDDTLPCLSCGATVEECDKVCRDSGLERSCCGTCKQTATHTPAAHAARGTAGHR